MKSSLANTDGVIDRMKGAGGLILGVSENRNWNELFYEGDLMHTKKINLPANILFDILVEEIPHKTTLYQHPHTLVYFEGPCDVEICREGNKIVVRGCRPRRIKG